MTTNKPEVVSWGSFYEGVMQDFGYNEEATKAAAELDFHGHTLSIEPLIRLSDYEALQAECGVLRTALVESRANDQQAMAYLTEVRAIVGGDDFPDMVRRCDQLCKDAERYRWIRLQVGVQLTGSQIYPASPYLLVSPPARESLAESTDFAIDASMQETTNDDSC